MTEFAPSEEGKRVYLFAKITRQQVILTASICVIALTVVLKNVLLVPFEVLIRDLTVYTLLYLGFLIFAFRPGGDDENPETVSPPGWDVLAVLITLTVLLVAAL